MTEQTIVAVYDTAAHAAAAVRALTDDNVPASAISQHAKATTKSGDGKSKPTVRERGFWGSVFGAEPDQDTTVYDRSIESGSTVVTVKVPEDHYASVAAVLEQHHPVDLDARTARYGSAMTAASRPNAAPAAPAVHANPPDDARPMGYGLADTTASRPTAAPTLPATHTNLSDETGTIQLSAETMSVGKRAVRGGTTRIRRYIVETPVEQQVTLHSEKVMVDRHPVTDGKQGGDFSDRTIEMTATDEQAVVSKTARVVEEISLRKEGSDRSETVKDTVRRQEIEVEEVAAASEVSGPATTTKPATTLPPGNMSASKR